MCYHRSCIVTEDERVLFHPDSDHHTQIRALHKIREEGFHGEVGQVALEIIPKRSLFDLGGWDIKVDQPVRPKWFDEALSKKVMEKMTSEFKKRANLNTRSYGGCAEVAIPYLERFENGSYITANKAIIVGGHTSPAYGCVFKATDIVIQMDCLRRWMECPFVDCTFIAQTVHDRTSFGEKLNWLKQHNDVVLLDERSRYERRCRNRMDDPFGRNLGRHRGYSYMGYYDPDMTNQPMTAAQQMAMMSVAPSSFIAP